MKKHVARRAVGTVPMLIVLDTHDATPLYRQIYSAIRSAILNGSLAKFARLPASRTLADDLGVSRTTVLSAYDQLAAEGYVRGKSGSGSRVAADIPTASHKTRTAPVTSTAMHAELSSNARAMVATYKSFNTAVPLGAFTYGIPAFDAFPVAKWARLTARRWRNTPRELLAPDDVRGFPALREAIAEYVLTSRAVHCTPEQIIVTAGAQQAIDIAARVLLNPGDSVWLEDPGFRSARAVFASVGARLIDVPVDDEGIDVAAGRKLAPHARMAFATPSHQAPLGVTMSLARRLALLSWAHEQHAWIVEDDYNGEFRYDGRPVAAMQGLEHPGAQRVIYVGTFSKTMFPSLRIGFAIVPPELTDAFMWARVTADRQSPTIEQAALADFIAEGHFAQHVRRMRDLYAERQDYLVLEAERQLGTLLHVRRSLAGMQLIGELGAHVSDVQVSREAKKRGVFVEPLSRHRANPSPMQALILGYANFRASEVRKGIRILGEAIRAARRTHSRT